MWTEEGGKPTGLPNPKIFLLSIWSSLLFTRQSLVLVSTCFIYYAQTLLNLLIICSGKILFIYSSFYTNKIIFLRN